MFLLLSFFVGEFLVAIFVILLSFQVPFLVWISVHLLCLVSYYGIFLCRFSLFLPLILFFSHTLQTALATSRPHHRGTSRTRSDLQFFFPVISFNFTFIQLFTYFIFPPLHILITALGRVFASLHSHHFIRRPAFHHRSTHTPSCTNPPRHSFPQYTLPQSSCLHARHDSLVKQVADS